MTIASPPPPRPVRGSTTGRPIMALFDLLGRRWILRIIWELHQADEPITFRDLRAASGDISSSVLSRRLGELAEQRLVTHTGEGYVLTDLGEALVTAMRPMLDWSRAWAPARACPPL